MTNTPRTDAVYSSSIPNICDHPDAVYTVPVEFARKLERELAESRKDTERLDWLEKNCTRAMNSERYLPRQVYWGGGCDKGIRNAIDAACEAGKGTT